MRERGVRLDLLEQRAGRVQGQLERLDLVALGDGDDDVVRLLHRLRDLLLRRLQVGGQRLPADQVDVLVLQLRLDLLPAQVVADAGSGDLQPLPRRHRQDHGVAVDAGAVRPRRLVEEPPRLGAGVARGGRRLRAQHGVVEIAVVGDVVGLVGQVVDLHLVAVARRARRQALERLDGLEQLRLDQVGRDPRAGVVVHLGQVRLRPQPPRLRHVPSCRPARRGLDGELRRPGSTSRPPSGAAPSPARSCRAGSGRGGPSGRGATPSGRPAASAGRWRRPPARPRGSSGRRSRPGCRGPCSARPPGCRSSPASCPRTPRSRRRWSVPAPPTRPRPCPARSGTRSPRSAGTGPTATASRSARANVRSTPRVRWKPSSWVHLV